VRISFDLPPEPPETFAQSLAVSASRLLYLVKLWGAVGLVYFIARAVLG